MRLPLPLAKRGRFHTPYLRSADTRFVWHADVGLYLAKPGGSLTLSGNEITDAVRAAGVEGDGLVVPDGNHGIWESTTNLLPNGGFESNTTGWTVAGGTIAATVAQAKFGAQSALVTKTGGAGNATAIFNGGGADIAVSPDTVYAAQVQCLRGTCGAKAGLLYIRWLDAAHAAISDSATDSVTLSGDWQRLAIVATSPATAAFAQVHFIGAAFGDTEDCYLDGVQLEQQPIATPYVETDGGAAGRSAARVRGPASLLDETQGWFAARFRYGFDAGAQLYTWSSGYAFAWGDGGNDRLTLVYDYINTRWTFERYAAAAKSDAWTAATGHSAGDEVTVIIAWTATTVAISINGGAFVVDSGAQHIPTLAAALFDIGAYLAGGDELDGDVLWAACGRGTLTDRDAAYLHDKLSANARWFSGWH